MKYGIDIYNHNHHFIVEKLDESKSIAILFGHEYEGSAITTDEQYIITYFVLPVALSTAAAILSKGTLSSTPPAFTASQGIP